MEEARAKGMELKGLSFKQVCQKIGYIPSHRVRELLKKFFWKRYQLSNNKTGERDTEKKRTGTKLYFTPSCLLSKPSLTSNGEKFDPSSPEVVYDREKLRGLTEEEASLKGQSSFSC